MERVCGDFSAHRRRMKYDEYLARGDPVATGVIEGACRHLVKDRMERSGMKWTCEGARELLHLRCLRASGYWEAFHKQRSAPHQPTTQLCGSRETPVTPPSVLINNDHTTRSESVSNCASKWGNW